MGTSTAEKTTPYTRKKTALSGGLVARASNSNISFVAIPKLRGSELRKMLRMAGVTLSAFSRFMGHCRSWASEVIVPLSNVHTSTVEGLYMMLGHDQFWTVYTRTTGREVPTETLIENDVIEDEDE